MQQEMCVCVAVYKKSQGEIGVMTFLDQGPNEPHWLSNGAVNTVKEIDWPLFTLTLLSMSACRQSSVIFLKPHKLSLIELKFLCLVLPHLKGPYKIYLKEKPEHSNTPAGILYNKISEA